MVEVGVVTCPTLAVSAPSPRNGCSAGSPSSTLHNTQKNLKINYGSKLDMCEVRIIRRMHERISFTTLKGQCHEMNI
jgi:hypothetical protein